METNALKFLESNLFHFTKKNWNLQNKLYLQLSEFSKGGTQIFNWGQIKQNIKKEQKQKKTWLGKVGTCQFHCFAANSQRIDSLFTSYFDMFYVRLTETQKYLDVFCSLFYPGNTLTVSLDMSVFLRTARKLGNCILKKVSEDNWK